MIIDDNLLLNSEIRNLQLKKLYSSYGYKSFRMSKFEEYDLYAKNKEFLVSDNVITFNDTNGKLMALKPDVTLSIIKNSKDLPDEVQRVFYNENVYRVAKGGNAFREMLQTGLECFGKVDKAEIIEVIELAVKSLKIFSENSVLALSDIAILKGCVDSLDIPSEIEREIYIAVGARNMHALDAIFENLEISAAKAEIIRRLAQCHGPLSDTIPELSGIIEDIGKSEDSAFESDARRFLKTLELLSNSDFADSIIVDFSVTDDTRYYSGIVFKGYVRGIPDPVISGGQYDGLMKKMGRRSMAIGFAVYDDALDRLDDAPESSLAAGESAEDEDDYINVALPKGRLGKKVYGMLADAGYECPELLEENRKLIFENPDKKVRYFWVKPSDVAIYVERGAADIGVVGKDILLESEPSVYELLDLKTGICRMAVAGPKSFNDDPSKVLRVATKFSNVAQQYYQSLGRDIELIHLNGSIEIAPILGLSDVIVDIVETGRTLKENNLEVKEEIFPISARLIANKSSFEFKTAPINKMADKLRAAVEEQND